MKLKALKRTLAIGCAIASLTQIPALGAFATTVNEVNTGWNTLIQREKQKYPETVNGQQCYWNGGNNETYTTKPCTSHSLDNFVKYLHFYDANYNDISQSTGSPGNGRPAGTQAYSQCYGFALKVSMDLYGNDTFCRYNLDSSCYMIYGDGTKKPYEPQVGDVVRVSYTQGVSPYHSIIITGINASTGQITFAQCNAKGQCEIDWDQTQVQYMCSDNKGRTMNVNTSVLRTYLAKNGTVERHCICGDLNLDGVIDSKDVTKFNQIVATGKINDTPDEAADVNHDGMVNEQDLAKLKAFTSSQLRNQHYVNIYDHAGSRYTHVPCAFLANGMGYDVTSDGNATYIGTVDNQLTSITIPSSVYDSVNNVTRKVTQIGREDPRYPERCISDAVQTFIIPSSVKKINRYAFMYTNLKNFSCNSSSNLTSIEESAFAGSKLTGIELGNMKKLKTVGNRAFQGCASLSFVSLPYSVTTIDYKAFQDCTAMTSFRICSSNGATASTGYCLLTNLNEQAFMGCTRLRSINLPYADQITFGNGVLTSMAASSKYPVRIQLANYAASDRLVRRIILDDADIAELKAGRIYFSYTEGRCNLMDKSGRILKSNGYVK